MRTDYPSSQGLPRFKYVEGLRALACLTVVFNHANAESYPSAYHVSIPENLSLLRLWFAFGHHAETAFIVISGFCLGLPVASKQFKREIGWGTFMVRRIARILPPYYAALIISLITAWAFFPSPVGIHYDFSAHPRSIDILSHVLVLQNIVGTGQINYSLWSIATELHIYAGFPLLVKVLSRRGGWFLAILGVLISFSLSFLLLETRLSRAYVHLAGAFIVGVGASWVVSSDHNHNFTNILRKISKPVAICVLTVVVAWTIILPRSLYKPFILPHDFLVMIGIGAVLIWCASTSGFGRKVLESRPLVWIGERSYSLYLLHVPIQAALLKVTISTLDLTHTERLVFSLTFGLGILLGMTWVFHRVVEIPAMNLSRRVSQLKQVAA